MKIHFKNVGQGDSILLEWISKGKNKIGVIDCKRYGGRNPIKDHFKKIDWESTDLEFIYLSHPHFDHFSGMDELISYCEKKNIFIKKFGHTFNNEQRYLDWSNLNDYQNSRLKELISHIIELKEQRKIGNIEIIVKRYNLPLNSKFSLQCIRPSDEEQREFTRLAYKKGFRKNNIKVQSKRFNLFSTFFLLYTNNSFCILSSDITFESLSRILAEDEEFFEGKKLLLAQVPHHGSIENHYKDFWNSLIRDINTPSVISSGEHKKYLHPHYNVVKDFSDMSFKIYSTNSINGIEEFILKHLRNTRIKLDMTSNRVIEFSGDHSFEILNERISKLLG
jgi:beta-lactamase superfamily II metal-dependent hydrolase